jgi:glutathione S-transferase
LLNADLLDSATASSEKMNHSRLAYFELRGRAEAIRVLLHATQAEFEDRRVISADEWGALKPELPFGGLPIFETGGDLVCESHAILRYLGKTLTPGTQNDLDDAQLDSAHDAIATFQEDLWRFNWVENYYDHLESYAEATLEPRLKMLSTWFCRKREGSPDWFGAEFSHVDCVAFSFLDEVDAFFPGVLAAFEELVALRARVASLPGVSDYLDSPARPTVFGMGSMGPKVDPRIPVPSAYEFRNPWSPPLDLVPFLRNQRRLTSAVWRS